MNKKALYASLLVLVVLLAASFLFFKMNKKFTSFSEGIGDFQSAVLKSSGDMFLLEEYLSESAYLAFDKAVKELPNNFIDFPFPDCEVKVAPFDKKRVLVPLHCSGASFSSRASCFVLNDFNNSGFCRSDFFSGFQNMFDTNFFPYVKNFNLVSDIKIPYDYEFSVLDDASFSIVFSDYVLSLIHISEPTRPY